MAAGLSGRAAFAAGTTAVRRDVLRGRVWAAAPHRVVRDSGGELVLAYWPGIESLASTTWIEWLGSGDDALRKQAIPNLARGQWELDRWVWRDTIVQLLGRTGEAGRMVLRSAPASPAPSRSWEGCSHPDASNLPMILLAGGVAGAAGGGGRRGLGAGTGSGPARPATRRARRPGAPGNRPPAGPATDPRRARRPGGVPAARRGASDPRGGAGAGRVTAG